MSNNACAMKKIGADVATHATVIVRDAGGAPKLIRATAMARRRAEIPLGEAEMLLWAALCKAIRSLARETGLPATCDPESLEDFTIRLCERLSRLLANTLTLLMVRIDEVREAE